MSRAATTQDDTKGKLQQILDRLRSSHLLMLVGGLFLLDLVIPDPIPFIDEAVLFILTALIARWQLRGTAPEAKKPPTKNVTPPG